MTRARILLAILLAVGTATNLRAQNGTAEALIALARGDYDTAARILKPLAESDTHADAAAQFLMATLYETGRGVPMLENRPDCIHFGAAGQVLGTATTLRDEFTAYVPSRPHLEWQIRRRVDFRLPPQNAIRHQPPRRERRGNPQPFVARREVAGA